MDSNKLMQALNRMRVEGSQVIHDSLEELTTASDIAKWSEAIFSNPAVYSEFADGFINKLVKSNLEVKMHNNKLAVFEGETLPYGYAVENSYTNPAYGDDYDPTDFAGILARYEADTKHEYFKINLDKQFKVTVYRDELRKAMLSLEALGRYINSLTNTLYNGLSILNKRRTIGLIGSAYENNRIQVKTLSAVTSKETAEAFSVMARSLFLNFQEESEDYNSWKKNGGEGRPIVTWSNPEDIYILVRNDVLAELDVKSLANSFNVDYNKLMGNVIGVNSFDVYDDKGNVIKAEDNLFACMVDKAYFQIHQQEMYMETSRNASARATTYFLNVIKSFNVSMFANAVVFATAEPSIDVEDIEFRKATASVKYGRKTILEIVTDPVGATSEITFTTADDDIASIQKLDDRHVEVTGESAGTVVITATSGDISDTCTVTVTPKKYATDLDFGITELALDTTETLELTITPEDSDENIVFESSNEEVFTVTKVDNTTVTLTEVGAGSATLYAKAKNATAIVTVTVS